MHRHIYIAEYTAAVMRLSSDTHTDMRAHNPVSAQQHKSTHTHVCKGTDIL